MREMEQQEVIPTKTNFLHKSLCGIKSFLYKRRQKLPDKSALIRPFTCGSTRQDLLLNHTYYSWDQDYTPTIMSNQHQALKNKKEETTASTDASSSSSSSSCTGSSFIKFAHTPRPVTKKLDEQETKARVYDNLLQVDAKMEELEMMELGEIENVLDMEEALHYYSRLRSPVYLGIVNKFLIDIYSDFSVPHQLESSASIINSSKTRFSSTRL